MFAVQRDRGITQTHTEFNAPCRQLTLLDSQDLFSQALPATVQASDPPTLEFLARLHGRPLLRSLTIDISSCILPFAQSPLTAMLRGQTDSCMLCFFDVVQLINFGHT